MYISLMAALDLKQANVKRLTYPPLQLFEYSSVLLKLISCVHQLVGEQVIHYFLFEFFHGLAYLFYTLVLQVEYFFGVNICIGMHISL